MEVAKSVMLERYKTQMMSNNVSVKIITLLVLVTVLAIRAISMLLILLDVSSYLITVKE
jgi:type IV secretory pathway component VirB8